MIIKLIKTGGIIGKKLTATAEWNFSAAEFATLINAIKRGESGQRKKDAFNYSIQQSADETTRVPISIQLIPEKYNAFFKELFDNLKAEK